MTKFVLIFVLAVWLLRFVRSQRTCSECGNIIRPDRVQPWYLTWTPFGAEWQCPRCGHRWKDGEK